MWASPMDSACSGWSAFLGGVVGGRIGGSGEAGWGEGDLISSVACLLTAGVGV